MDIEKTIKNIDFSRQSAIKDTLWEEMQKRLDEKKAVLPQGTPMELEDWELDQLAAAGWMRHDEKMKEDLP